MKSKLNDRPMRLWLSGVLTLALMMGFLSFLYLKESRGESPPGGEIIPPSSIQIRHPVGPGEDLHLLAAYYYGDARQWKRIHQSNHHLIKNPNRISIGQILHIELPSPWQPLMPFPRWMERVRGESLPKGVEEIAVPEKTPLSPDSGKGEAPKPTQ